MGDRSGGEWGELLMANYLATDTDLAAVANAIRTKGGTSAGLTFPSGFVDAIGDISGGGGINLFRYANNCMSFLQGASGLPETFVVDFTDNTAASTLESFFLNTSGIKSLTIKNLVSSKTNMSMKAIVYNCSDLETLTFENCTVAPNSLESFGRGCTKLKAIYGEIDCTNCTSNNSLSYWFANNATKIETFRIKPNTIKISPGSNLGLSEVWEDATYISLANGLDGSVSSKTLTLSTFQKNAMQAIMGTNDNGTFVADAQGTLSVSAFITTVKGWALA